MLIKLKLSDISNFYWELLVSFFADYCLVFGLIGEAFWVPYLVDIGREIGNLLSLYEVRCDAGY